MGHLFGGTIDDAFGTGGWGLTGPGEGGGGFAQTSASVATASAPSAARARVRAETASGIGHGTGKLGGAYKPRELKGPRRQPETNGHLPAEVIQRIVRQNMAASASASSGAQDNPNLEGRVTVKFVIGRDGAVMIAADGGSDIPDAGVRQCVVSAFQTLSFPAPDSGLVTVVYPITFSPQ